MSQCYIRENGKYWELCRLAIPDTEVLVATGTLFRALEEAVRRFPCQSSFRVILRDGSTKDFSKNFMGELVRTNGHVGSIFHLGTPITNHDGFPDPSWHETPALRKLRRRLDGSIAVGISDIPSIRIPQSWVEGLTADEAMRLESRVRLALSILKEFK